MRVIKITYIKKSLLKNPITRPSCEEMNENNCYTLITERTCNSYYYKYASEGFIYQLLLMNLYKNQSNFYIINGKRCQQICISSCPMFISL